MAQALLYIRLKSHDGQRQEAPSALKTHSRTRGRAALSILEPVIGRLKRFIRELLKDNSSHALYDDRGYIRP